MSSKKEQLGRIKHSRTKTATGRPITRKRWQTRVLRMMQPMVMGPRAAEMQQGLGRETERQATVKSAKSDLIVRKVPFL